MAKTRKTPKPKQPTHERIDRKSDPLKVYEVLDDMVLVHRKDLKDADCRIALAWRYGWKRNKDGQVVLGKCKKVSDLDKQYAGFDFIIILNAEAWKTLNEQQRDALMHHELCHAAISTDQNGNPKLDARGRQLFRVKKHDLEEFREVVAIHGCYKGDIADFVRTAQNSKAKPQPSLFDTNHANLGNPSQNGKIEKNLEKVLEDESNADAKANGKPAESPTDPKLAELWREFPISRWTQFGLTAGDVERLASGEVKRGSGFPIVTVVDYARFSTPFEHTSFVRNLTDIKGIGQGAADRISDANVNFFGWWSKGGAEDFAKEKGIEITPKAEAEAEGPDKLRGGTNSGPASIPHPSMNGHSHANGKAKSRPMPSAARVTKRMAAKAK